MTTATASPPRTPTDARVVIKLIGRACTNAAIQDLLRRIKNNGDSEARCSGNSEELLEQLHDAYERGSITTNALARLLGRGEENGNQFVFHYGIRPGFGPRSRRAVNLDYEAVGTQLFGSGWRQAMSFPDLHLNPDEQIRPCDFRDEKTADNQNDGWVLKFAAGRMGHLATTESDPEYEDHEDGRLVIINRQVVKQVRRVVFVVRWRPLLGTLEIRISNQETGAKAEIKRCLDGIWEAIHAALPRRAFKPWNLQPGMKRLYDDSLTTGRPWTAHQALAADNDGHPVLFMKRDGAQQLTDSKTHTKSLENYPLFRKLELKFVVGHGDQAETLRAEMGFDVVEGERANCVRYGAKASPAALDYAAHRFHEYCRTTS